MLLARRHVHAAVMLIAVPLAALSLLGNSWRYGVVAIAAFIPLVALVFRLLRRECTDKAG